MADAKLDPKSPTHPCPLCKKEGENVLLMKEDNVIQIPVTKIQQSSILTLPKAIEMLLVITDLYLCRTCGIRYEKVKKEQTAMAQAQYVDEQGRPVDPNNLPAGR